LRCQRFGKKKHPIYRVVAADNRSPRDGSFIENLGNYDPNTNPITAALKENRVLYWLKSGARPSETVRSVLKQNGFWLRWTLMRQGKDEAQIQPIVERWQMLQPGKAKNAADRKVRRTAKKKAASKSAQTPAASTSVEAPAAS
jgi:small subunit ribosomal protein S16